MGRQKKNELDAILEQLKKSYARTMRTTIFRTFGLRWRKSTRMAAQRIRTS